MASSELTPDLTEQAREDEQARQRHARTWNSVVAAGGLSVLGLAALLPPDPAGFGTHQKLGLPPCTMLRFTGIPCPFCGMTTSFAHFAHGDPVGSFVTQPAGSVLFLLTVVAVIFFAWRAAIGHRDSPDDVIRGISGRVWLVALAGLLLAWAYKIFVVVGA